MKKDFLTILDKHEQVDFDQMNFESLFLNAILREYSNGKEIIDTAIKNNLKMSDFLTRENINFPIIPIRQCENFQIKKHTLSQIPYYHSHNFYEVIYVHSGSCHQKFNNGDDIILNKNQCLIISPGKTHLIEKSNKTDIILKMVIPKEIFEHTGKLILGDIENSEIIKFDFMSETAEFLLLKLLDEQERDSNFKDLIISNYLTLFFIELKETFKSNITLKNILFEYFAFNIKNARITEFAKTHNYNANYASRLIKTQLGTTFSELLTGYRLNYSTELLNNSEMSIEEIADAIGYSTVSGFYKQFFNKYGLTPAKYRKLLK